MNTDKTNHADSTDPMEHIEHMGHINDTDNTCNIEDIFDKDFEVIYEGELPELPNDLGSDDYKDVLSNLSELDPTNSMSIDYLAENRTRTINFSEDTKKYPFSVSGTSRTGGRASAKPSGSLADLLLRGTALFLIVGIAALLAVTFWEHSADYGTITESASGQNSVLGAYFATSLFFLLIECITFLVVLFGNKAGHNRKRLSIDTVCGLCSFLFIYVCSWLSGQFAGLIPSAPVLLQGVKGALTVYGTLSGTLLALCGIGVVSCLARSFFCKGK